MNSKKKSLLGLFSICSIFVLTGVLFAFSISAASETEAVDPTTSEVSATEEALAEEFAAEDPATEEAVVEEVAEEPTTEAPSVTEEAKAENKTADPVVGPLTVLNSAGQPATTDDCDWDDEKKVYTIKADGLTFKGYGTKEDCCIETFDEVFISSVSLDNVWLSPQKSSNSLLLEYEGDQDLILNIINCCSFEKSIGISSDSNYPERTLTINGSNSSMLKLNCNRTCLYSSGFQTSLITGGISIWAKGSSDSILETDTESLIFDTTGTVYVCGTDPNSCAILANSDQSCNINVKKGLVELHSNSDEANGDAAIVGPFAKPVITLSDGLPMVGAVNPTATLSECKEGVTFDYYPSTGYNLSSIDGQPAGTVFIGATPPDPVPTPGGESSETAQTWDSVPSAAIALLAIIAISSFVVLRNRKSNR